MGHDDGLLEFEQTSHFGLFTQFAAAYVAWMPVPERIVAALIAWFAAHARDLPWRRTRDPYAIWIAEVMLQQTQVRTVIPFWERWLTALPDVRSLARCPLPRVLKLWEGLGYYRRAEYLHAAARRIVTDFNGTFPDEFKSVRALPGVGRYTAGAVCSIAFDQPAPIVDGNVTRVLARLHGLRHRPDSSQGTAQLWKWAEELVTIAHRNHPKQERPCASLNQALMELGATVCTPHQAHCGRCPVQSSCTAFHSGRVHELPRVKKRPRTVQRRFLAFIASCQGRIAVRQRPNGSANAHLWEFPNVEIVTGKLWTTAAKGGHARLSEVHALAASCLGCDPLQIEPLCTIRHTITRFRISVAAYYVRASGAFSGPKGIKWRSRGQLEMLAFPSAHRQILTALREKERRPGSPGTRRGGGAATRR